MRKKLSHIRPMHSDDVDMVVAVHQTSFPGFFLSFLGPGFLKLYYRNICLSPDGLCYVYTNDEGLPCGFVAGTSNPRGYYSRLLKREWFNFAIASIYPVCRHPKILPRLLRALLHPGKNPVGKDVAGLFSLGVLPELQGTGAGKKLVQKFLAEAKVKNCKKVFLTTDRENNKRVNNFYENLGFSVERQYETPEGRKMNEYWINL